MDLFLLILQHGVIVNDGACQDLIVFIAMLRQFFMRCGMIADFTHIKREIHDRLDHGNFNELLPFNPTAENIARWICDQIPTCWRVDVQESEGNVASYEVDE